jgi:hypothetical protein
VTLGCSYRMYFNLIIYVVVLPGFERRGEERERERREGREEGERR